MLTLSTALAICSAAPPAAAQTTIFADDFGRADNRNIDASLAGITDNTGSPLAADGVYTHGFVDPNNDDPTNGAPDANAGNGGGARILSNQLELAEGSGTSNAFINHNFINPSILTVGGFSVSVDLAGSNQSGSGQGGGFAIGMSQADAAGTGDAFNAATKMQDAFTGAGNDATRISIADFWAVLRADGTLIWGGAGNALTDTTTDPQAFFGSANVGSKTGTISANFTLNSFDDGASVDYEVFHNGASQGTGSFTWSGTGQNYIGLEARDSQGVFFDNLQIAEFPNNMPAATLTANPASIPATSTAEPVSLTWTGAFLPAGATYRITADKPVTFPNADSTGSAAAGTGTVDAVVNGTLGITTFTLELLDGPVVIASGTARVAPERPNVVLIMTDDMGWSDFGCYGSEIRTPTIDSLAANGIAYRNFYNTARCSTTRCALLSGLYTQQVAANPGASLPNLLDTNNVTIAELLATTGYRRYMAGKWHVGTSADRSPIGRGFQHIFGQTSGGTFPHNQVSGGNHDSFWNESNFGYYSENDEVPEIDYASEYPGVPFHQTTFIGEYSLRFLDHHLAGNDGAPFFLYMPFNAVHWDINAPNDMADRYTDVADLSPDGLTANGGLDGGDYYQYEVGWDQVRADRFARQLTLGARDASYTLSPRSPSIQSTGTSGNNVITPAWADVDGGNDRRNDLARRMALYAAMLEMVDQNIKKVVDKLTAENLLDNTIIFVIADNGGNYEGGLYGKTSGTVNAAPVTGTTNLRNMGQPGNPDLHVGGGWANLNNTPFRLFKHFQHEGGIRSPCIIHYPDGITSTGRWIDERGHLIDIMATIADVTETTYPATFTDPDNSNVRTLLPLEGASLAPHFDPATVGNFPDRPIGFEHESNRAWIDGNWKLTTKNFAFVDGSSPANELELYDLSVDPTELNNLATSNPAKLAEMMDAWNAWANRVGVPSDRLLIPVGPPGPQLDPPMLPEDLFVDTFNRDDNPDPDASLDGMWGSRLPSMGADAVYYDSHVAGETDLISLGLHMAVGSGGMTENGVQHNFIGADILAAGGFSVSLRIDNIVHTGTLPDPDRFGGFGVGLSQAEAQAGADIGATTPPLSFRGKDLANGSADLFLDLDIDGSVKAYHNGTLLVSVPVGRNTGTLLAGFECTSFAAGANVTVTAFLDGQLIDLDPGGPGDTLSFQWDNTDANYLGLSARANTRVELDNFAVRTLPLGGALAAGHANLAGLSGADAAPTADPDNDGDDNQTEWLKGSDPNANDAQTQLLSLAPTAAGEFRFNWFRLIDAGAAGVTYTFRYSDDLVNWTDFTPEELSSAPEGGSHELVLARVPAADLDDPLHPGQARPRLFVILGAAH